MSTKKNTKRKSKRVSRKGQDHQSLTESFPPDKYIEAAHFLCQHHRMNKHPVEVSMAEIFSSLRLDFWSTMDRVDHSPLSPEEAIVHATLHDPQDPENMREFADLLQTTPYSPADAICALLHIYPGFFDMMGLTLDQQKKALSEPEIDKALRSIYPPQFHKRQNKKHVHRMFLMLLKSVEYWLLVLMRTR